jgi:hypothetical protein
MTARIVSINKYSAKEIARIDTAVALAVHVINLPQFREAVLGYGGNDPTRSFVERSAQPLGMSNQDVWAAFTRAAEGYAQEPDGELDLHLVGKHRFLRWPWGWPGYPVGHGYDSDDPPIYTYHTWIRENSIAALAGHLVHEWTHKIDFVHDKADTETRPCSVPYVLGYQVEFFANQLRANNTAEVRAPNSSIERERHLVYCDTPHPAGP